MAGAKARKQNDDGKALIEELLRDADRMVLSAQQKARLRYALMLRGSNSTRKDRQRADRVVAEVQREVLAGAQETMRMERERGGEVLDFNDAGAKRLSSRDGLLNLYEAKRITEAEREVGLAYRKAREAYVSVPSQLGASGIRGGDVDHVGAGLTRVKLSVAAAKVDYDVALALRHRPDALEVLRRVAGDGQCLRSLAPGGAQFERLLEGLRMALAIAGKRLVKQGA